MQILVNCETRLCSQFLGPGDNFLQSYGAIFTDRAATGSGSLMDTMSTAHKLSRGHLHVAGYFFEYTNCARIHMDMTYARIVG